MWQLVAVLVYVSVHSVKCRGPGPSYPPTKGQVWPKPAQEWKERTVLSFNSDVFTYEVKNYSCKLLEQAIERCKGSIDSVESIAKHLRSPLEDQNLKLEDHNSNQDIRKIRIDLKRPCEEYPHMDMDESYNLTVTSNAELSSESIWGIIRGLETFSELLYLSNDYKEVLLRATEIVDYPQYPYRGLMLDTSRHYISVANILKTLDAMAMNKMNVFHWHIVDDQSFPYQRHGSSWELSHPEIFADCSGSKTFNPIKNETYEFMKELFEEVQKRFPDKYFHLGGDEVETTCWSLDPDIKNYMKNHNITDPYELQKLYTETVVPLLKEGTVPIVWEEAYFQANATLSANSLIHIWGWNWDDKMVDVLSKGHKVLFSSYWYLDYKYWKYEFQDFYTGDPRFIVYNKTSSHDLGRNIVGGEACMWGEMVDDNNVISRVWPRASAPAEVLWSFTDGTVPPEAYNRIEEHTCRMIRRGISAEPGTGSGYCVDVNNVVAMKSNAQSSRNTLWEDSIAVFYGLFM